ncbi:hypothetical protein CYMTET_14624 [Cymbomonas tetramitiformis]|uniref:Uncharacterized protein n=1 Tax=Cymbomonas tetramitiformis TaxID=36881 RepID=A0AAE0GG73_9CHLO|nr:hypothetical protein CYMTET_14624 [Cymbomonas tetramitiformis]
MVQHMQQPSDLVFETSRRLREYLPAATTDPSLWSDLLETLKDEVVQGAAVERAWSALCEMGQVLLDEATHEQRNVEAAGCYKVALALRPEEGLGLFYLSESRKPCPVWLRCGNLLYQAGQFAEAVKVFRYGLSLDRCAVTSTQQYINEVLVAAERSHAGSDAEQLATPRMTPARGWDDHLTVLRAKMNVNLGVALESEGRIAEAGDAYRSAIKIKPTMATAHKLLGGVYMEQGRWQEAEAALATAVELQPDFVDAWIDLGLVRRHVSHPQATEALETAAGLRPDVVLAVWYLAMTHRDNGEYARSMQGFTRVLELRPSFWGAHVQHAVCVVLLEDAEGGMPRALADLMAAALKAHLGETEVTAALDALLRAPEAPTPPKASSSPRNLTLENDQAEEMCSAAPENVAGDNQAQEEIGDQMLPLPASIRAAAQALKQQWSEKLQQRAESLATPRGGFDEWSDIISGVTADLWAGEPESDASALSSEPWKPEAPQGFKILAQLTSSTGGFQVVVSAADQMDAAADAAQPPTSDVGVKSHGGRSIRRASVAVTAEPLARFDKPNFRGVFPGIPVRKQAAVETAEEEYAMPGSTGNHDADAVREGL